MAYRRFVLFAAFAPATLCAQIGSRRPVITPKPDVDLACPTPRAGAYDATVITSKDPTSSRFALLTICLTAAPRLEPFAAYQGTLSFSPMLVVDTVMEALGGTRTENSATTGEVRFAGVHLSGFGSGPVLTVRVHLPNLAVPVAPRLSIDEVNSSQGASLMPRVWVQDRAPTRVAAHATGAPPKISSAAELAAARAPRIGLLDRENVSMSEFANGHIVVVTINGMNFDPNNNTITFGPTTLPRVRSEKNGTILKFTLPIMAPTRRGARAQSLDPSDYMVTVSNSKGVSNAVRFRIKP